MIAALVPVKALPRSKSRLRPVLSDDQRQALVVAMLEDVLRLLAGVPAVATTAVVSPDADLLALARQLGAQAIREPPQPGGLNAALTFASRMLCDQGARTLLVLPIDVPLATADDIEAILDRVRGNPSIVLCPSRSGGTNALALRPPGIIPFRFGRHSSAAHQREARARGLPLTVLSLPSLALDIDRPKDLAAVLAQPNGSRSRELLASLPLDLTSLWQTAADPTPSPHPLVLRRHALILSPSKDERTRAHGSTGSP